MCESSKSDVASFGEDNKFSLSSSFQFILQIIDWIEHKDFFPWIEEAQSTEVVGSPMFMLYSKLKAIKTKLKRVNKDLYGCISQKVLLARQKLESVQLRLLQKNSEVGLRTLEQDCLHEFSAVQKPEESFLKQKSRSK